jgi:hypothetical protein
MPDIHAYPIEASDIGGTIESAAYGLADSITRGLHDKPWTILICLVVWAVTAPALFLWNAI